MKATAQTLGEWLSRVEVTLSLGAPAALVGAPGINPNRWSMRELGRSGDDVGALAVEGHIARLERRCDV